MKALILALACALTSCSWLPVAHIPTDAESALVVRCREVEGWFGRDSRWLMLAWVWSKSATMPVNPGNIEVDSDCVWRVNRTEPVTPSATAVAPAHPRSAAPPHPAAEPPPK